jgi:cytochrome c peroxidase
MSSSTIAGIVLALAQPPAASEIAKDRLPAELAILSDAEVARIARMSPLPPLATDETNRYGDDVLAAELGHRLFFDTRLSPKGISCAGCHDPAKYFTDGRPLAQGIGVGSRNTPTVVDSARRRWIGWDGKFDSVWSQALSPIEHPAEMGGSRARLHEVVRDDPDLRAMYERVFGALPASQTDAATANLLKALGAYQRQLQSPKAPIDRLIASLRGQEGGDLEALGTEALRGLALFVSKAGCYQCHRGPSFTDEEFHSLGLVGANGRVPDDPARLAAIDFLRANPMNAAGIFSDAPSSPKAAMVRGLRRAPDLFGQFRTPPLRGVAQTAPFMHDGRMATLEDVVRFYDTLEGASPIGHHGESVLAPLGLGESGRADLMAFLRSLTPGPSEERWWKPPQVSVSASQPAPIGR